MCCSFERTAPWVAITEPHRQQCDAALNRRNNGKNLAWDTFKSEMRERYERSTIRSDLLCQKLENVRYEGPSQMIEYCTAFHAIEQQIFNMNFDNKLRTFLRPLPTNC